MMNNLLCEEIISDLKEANVDIIAKNTNLYNHLHFMLYVVLAIIFYPSLLYTTYIVYQVYFVCQYHMGHAIHWNSKL